MQLLHIYWVHTQNANLWFQKKTNKTQTFSIRLRSGDCGGPLAAFPLALLNSTVWGAFPPGLTRPSRYFFCTCTTQTELSYTIPNMLRRYYDVNVGLLTLWLARGLTSLTSHKSNAFQKAHTRHWLKINNSISTNLKERAEHVDFMASRHISNDIRLILDLLGYLDDSGITGSHCISWHLSSICYSGTPIFIKKF